MLFHEQLFYMKHQADDFNRNNNNLKYQKEPKEKQTFEMKDLLSKASPLQNPYIIDEVLLTPPHSIDYLRPRPSSHYK